MTSFGISESGQRTTERDGLPYGLRVHIRPLTDIFNTLYFFFRPNMFLANIFERAVLLDQNGIEKASLSSPTARDTVRFYCGPASGQRHIMIDCVPRKGPKLEQIKASGFKYSYFPEENGDGQDPKNTARAQMAIKERAFAAITMVETAKARGWTAVNFAGTTDPVERYILSLACDSLGMAYKETINIPEDDREYFAGIAGMFENFESLRMSKIMIDGDENFVATPSVAPAEAPEADEQEDFTAFSAAEDDDDEAGENNLDAFMAKNQARHDQFLGGGVSPS